ncbi:succinylglutamate desuccinylase/aspartoacylase family protein [Paraferrimonas sedimenticola]|uniref:Deacylase n=1 Tax=Paraferrimonas sedimenticola TaxID=375674 RepID=A0AA37RX41_9GAMM|nr:succinylglutamate desuccinylase/aspartoacylase family protein [Paraferrimonas sedimenticola]GLP96292.1 deacylase [Paraferrimonas sedimenticola]
MTQEVLQIAGVDIAPGRSLRLAIPVAKLYTDTQVSIPIQVIRAKKPGPVVFVSAAVHGDELNGIEIIRRLINSKRLSLKAGTLILVPMVNVYGVLNQSRYMPDRRDLNRCFPGSEKGSLAARVASIFIEEVVRHCDYGIDLHTAAIHRANLPQIRANLKDAQTREMAEAFGVSVMMNSDLRDGSLRQAAVESDTRILLYEAGQALRFDEVSIRAGVKGVLNVLSHLNMLKRRMTRKKVTPFMANNSAWVRANASGIVTLLKELGDQVSKGEPLAIIGNSFGDTLGTINAHRSGVIVGMQKIPLVQEGDAMFHIAYFSEDEEVIAEQIEAMHDELIQAETEVIGAMP